MRVFPTPNGYPPKRKRGRPPKVDKTDQAERSRRHRERQKQDRDALEARVLELEQRLADLDGLLLVDLPSSERSVLRNLVGEDLKRQQEWARRVLIEQVRSKITRKPRR